MLESTVPSYPGCGGWTICFNYLSSMIYSYELLFKSISNKIQKSNKYNTPI